MSNKNSKKKIVIFIGAGFSTALTRGNKAPIGLEYLPTLQEFSGIMLEYLKKFVSKSNGEDIPFSKKTILKTINILEQYESTKEIKYNFEELLSMLTIQAMLKKSNIISNSIAKENIENILNCLIFFIPRLFADRLAIDRKLKKNRNFFYAVNNKNMVRFIQKNIWDLCDNNCVTFISFNYDGLLEAFLDCDLTANQRGERPVFRYFPEFSHGVQFVMPEHIHFKNGHIFIQDTRDFNRIKENMPSTPLVLKPHGSIHFYPVKPEIVKLINIRWVALHPRFDIGFNPQTMQRDISDVLSWRFINPVPLIVPPIINKDDYLKDNYCKKVFKLVANELMQAEKIISLGFSIPRSDLHIASLLHLIATSKNFGYKSIGIVYKKIESDITLENWIRIFGEKAIDVLEENGIPVANIEDFKNFWDKLIAFIQ